MGYVFAVDKDRLLACTAGQVKYGVDSLGVQYEDIEKFMEILISNLPIEVLGYFETNDLYRYLGDNFKVDGDIYNGYVYMFKSAGYQARDIVTIGIEVQIQKDMLSSSLSYAGYKKSNAKASKIIDTSIQSFKEYYGEKYGYENLPEEDKIKDDDKWTKNGRRKEFKL